jgi:integrase
VSLQAVAVDVFRRVRADQNERRLLLGAAWHDDDVVFDRGDGLPMDPSRFSHDFTKIARRAGHLRHAYATSLLAAGIHPKIASEALGHSSVSITLDTYSHLLPSMGSRRRTRFRRR